MSWIENIKHDLVITTGDKVDYKPQWLNASKAKEYNVSEFNFPTVDGTLVYRQTPRGRRYNLEIYFQGEDHLETSSKFETSADDPRAWVISHPFYGRLLVHPISLTFDNSVYNITKITGELLETIEDENPKTTRDPADDISIQKESVDESIADTFATDVKPDTTDINTLSDINNNAYEEGKKGIKLDIDSSSYFNAFNTANSAILNATEAPFKAMAELQAMINAPALFITGVKNRISTLIRQFEKLRTSVTTIFSRSGKKIHEATSGTLISALTLGAITNTDYKNTDEVLDTIEDILANYDLYISDLDSLQTDDNGEPTSFIPDAGVQIALNNLIVFTVNNLLKIAVNAKQKRTIILEEDNNVIVLTHRFFGLDATDENLDEFINLNDIGISELLQIRKGRPISYYI